METTFKHASKDAILKTLTQAGFSTFGPGSCNTWTKLAENFKKATQDHPSNPHNNMKFRNDVVELTTYRSEQEIIAEA